jgi:oligopeptide transport system ATP-binding protein
MGTPRLAFTRETGPVRDTAALLQVRGLKKYFPLTRGIVFKRQLGWVKAVDGVDFTIYTGESFGVVGESGCGKTTLSRLLLLIDKPTEGTITFDGLAADQLTGEGLREYRAEMQPVFQDPYSSLSPRMPVWEIIAEPLIVSGGVSSAQARERAAELLQEVGLSRHSLDHYPHQFSGGQRQRIAIARALSSSPKFLVLDEPVSALDVSIRAQIMNLLKRLQREYDLTLFMIAHDLGTVRYMSDRIMVMYLGRVVEIGPAADVYRRPLHPYTQALLASALPLHPDAPKPKAAIRGEVPSPVNPPSGCRFRTRCPFAMPVCAEAPPPLKQQDGTHGVACYLYP